MERSTSNQIVCNSQALSLSVSSKKENTINASAWLVQDCGAYFSADLSQMDVNLHSLDRALNPTTSQKLKSHRAK
ncbi:hypothetical protein PSHT_05275 [Puccinia striiformis]|uniref:Uncharacterized protein n=1 Tax=Puccinia striiformis TaxID=27350 RepID=A0A2S4WB53_9BASI|nr:hypothetical protein PSHT_05275 [Puccinia striiformis]